MPGDKELGVITVEGTAETIRVGESRRKEG